MELAVPEIGSAEMEGIWPPWHHLPPRSGAISKVIFQVRGLPVSPECVPEFHSRLPLPLGASNGPRHEGKRGNASDL